MLERPDIDDRIIIARLHEAYALQVKRLEFLPLGADENTAVFRVITGDETEYFLKLRKGDFNEIAVEVPHYLKAEGNPSIIAPIGTHIGWLWASLKEFRMILYPYIEGQNGYQATLTDQQWQDFGAALRTIHQTQLSSSLARQIPKETFSSQGRELVKQFQDRVENFRFADPTAAKLAAFMKLYKWKIDRIVARAEELAMMLKSRSVQLVLCHSDVHPGNLLICANGALYIVDWDNPILAPKERDLALVGGCPTWKDPGKGKLFYRGYGKAEIDPVALAYFRYERIVQDIAAFCQQLLLSDEGGEDREQSYIYFTGQFLPDHEIDIALRTDRVT
jgi:spectinomycin phosphotransferase